jgi:predicted ArsR family transcriptional regulator
MTSLDHRIADGSSRAGVLKVLRDRRVLMRVEDLAEAVNLSLSAVRFHLDRLIAEGLVRTAKEPRQTPGRPRVMYQAVPEEAVDDGAAYRRLAMLLATELAGRGGAPAAEAAGRAWAAQVLAERSSRPPRLVGDVPAARVSGEGTSASVRATGRGSDRDAVDLPDCLADMMTVLEDGGFAPRLVDGGWGVELHRCPFADLMPDQSEVVCSVHKGLMQSLPELDGAHDQVRLDPTPQRDGPCILHFVR